MIFQAFLVSSIAVSVNANCMHFAPEIFTSIYADMHDGDKKEVTISGTAMTIKPSGNKQTWVVKTEFDRTSCTANVDFNVPGKPSPPPVNLTASFLVSFGKEVDQSGYKSEFGFTDPSGKLAPKSFPLNRWVELSKLSPLPAHASKQCPPPLKGVFQDMHDGDKKEVSITENEITIKPIFNNQTWAVKSHFDRKACSAVIDFRVPGKPGPPPVALTAGLQFVVGAAKSVFELEFTDPTGTLAAADFPLNHWVEIQSGNEILL